MKAFLLFPHQLFEENLTRKEGFNYYLSEEPLYFSQYKFHKQKLILHRASMKQHESLLKRSGYTVTYLEDSVLRTSTYFHDVLVRDNITEIHYYYTADDWLEQKIKKEIAHDIKTIRHESPMFLSSFQFLDQEFKGKEHFSMASFYIQQRKRLNILTEKNGKPAGGKWSFDTENRKKLPKNSIPPPLWTPAINEFVKEAMRYVDTNYSDHYGDGSSFSYAITHKDARTWLQHFLENRFVHFGPYEDAISPYYTHLFHSVLTPYLNTGLLTPDEVIRKTISFADENMIPLNSLEGFIRQIIGWREFMHAVYLYKGRFERTNNFWDHTRKLPYSFWNGTTGIAPVDTTIKRVLSHAYTHHIERLMIMGNFMLLCEIDPDDIYQWFMEMYIDAYDWVMVPNVYSMSQYAGGGNATTKPYISGSNYVLKMSNYKKDAWCEVWDGLYWRFIDKHKEFFAANNRLSAMTLHLKKMDKETLGRHYKNAEAFLKKLETSGQVPLRRSN